MKQEVNPGALADATGALEGDLSVRYGSLDTTTDALCKAHSRRERDDNYRAEIVRLGSSWRVILCKDGIQWIVQRRDGESAGRARWTGSRYFRTRKALIAFCRTLCGPCDPAALARLALLPEVLG